MCYNGSTMEPIIPIWEAWEDDDTVQPLAFDY